MGIRKKRIDSWDCLRGILALTIMIYHYLLWMGIDLPYPFDQLIDRMGIYAVSIFFIISGAVLAISYTDKTVDKEFLINYFKKRVLRIIPLFYVATTISVAIGVIASSPPSVFKVFNNYTLIFGFIDPNGYIATGGWFIGNQIVFYVLFPLVLLVLNKSIKRYLVLLAGTVLLAVFYSLKLLNTSVSLSDQWSTYINPLNHLFFFTGGILLGYLYIKGKIFLKNKVAVSLMTFSILSLTFYTASNLDQAYIVTGINRIIFVLIVFTLCFSVIFVSTNDSLSFVKITKKLGEISYPIYLFHPIVYTFTSAAFDVFGYVNGMLEFIISFIVSIIVATIAQKLDNHLAEYMFKNKNPIKQL